MGRKAKRCQKNCQSHRFLLKPVHYSAVFSRELEASYCPASLSDPSITPRFNKDKRHFTTSFLLPVDQVKMDLTQQKLEVNAEFYRTEHDKYKLENTMEKSTVWQAKPKSKYSYCSVCKADYEDYLTHIKSETHKNKIRDNKFNSYIDEMCEDLKEQNASTLLQSEEFKNVEVLQNKLSFFTQESSAFDLNCYQKQTPTLSQACEYKQISDWFHTCKTFQLLPQINDQNPLILHEDHEGIPTHPPFSPFKRCSEPTEAARQISNIRPIILFGSQCQMNT